MSKRNKEQLAAMTRTYGAQWTCAAIERTALRGKSGLGYAAAILSSWQARGGMDEPGEMAGKPYKNAANGANVSKAKTAERSEIPTYFDMFAVGK